MSTATTLDPTTYRTTDEYGLFTQSKAKSSKDLGKNEFMTLLVQQMQNQDPLEPVQNQDFIAQLATFSSLEQLTDLNKQMTSLSSGQDQLINSQSLTLIGRDVVANTDGTVRLGAGGADKIVCQFDSAPASARVLVQDSHGNTLRTINMNDAHAGLNTVQWDGKDDHGNALAAGDYKFKVVTSDGKGNDKVVDGYVTLHVDGIHIGANGIEVVSGDRTVGFSNVIEILASQTAGATGN